METLGSFILISCKPVFDEQRNLDKSVPIAMGDLTIFADRRQIEQLLMNLVTNARDAMPMGGTITMETQSVQIGISSRSVDSEKRAATRSSRFQMPGKNGKEAYEEIRVINPSLRAIFVSGHAEDIFSREGLLEQGINFGRKPVTPLALVNKVRKVLDA